MKVNTFGKASLGLALASTLALGLGVGAANAAGLTATQEDPAAATIGPNTLVGVGSDTIQDVEYGISQDLGKDSSGKANLASWTATGTTPMSYRSGGTPAVPSAHPNGSGPGYTALKESLGITAATADGVGIGDVDYSRASGFQGTEVSGGGGVVTEIPFAIDAISFAAPSGSPFLLTNGAKGLTVADLANIYSGVKNEVNTTTGALGTESVVGTPDAGNLPIQAFLPKSGSGSRQFFLKQLNAVNSAVAYGSDKGDSDFTTTGAPSTGANPKPYVGAENADGSPVQEHDATILTSADKTKVAAIAPFSAAKFIGYHNGTVADPDIGKAAGTDYVLVPFDSSKGAVLPYTGTTTLAPNPAYQAQGAEGNASLTREVFNIIPTAAVKAPTASATYSALVATFVGATSKFCADTATIQAYGFLTDSNCGNTSRTADTASTSTVTVSHTAAVAGKTTTFRVSVQSIGNGGGSLRLTIAGLAHTAIIAKGSTSASFVVATPKGGSLGYGGGTSGFTPNLGGVATSPITAGSFTVAKGAPFVHATAAKVSHKKAGKVVVTVTATGEKPTGKVTVVIKKGASAKVTKTVTLSGGKATAALKKLPKGSYTVYVSYTGDGNVSAKASTKLATLKVS